MSYWLDAAKLFEENSKEGNYFEAQSGVHALKRIQTFIETTFPQMFFLLGEPGSGKSFMLHHLYRLYSPQRLCVLIENPFLSPEQLLRRLLACRGIVGEIGDLEELRIKAIDAYRGIEHLIMIDEGQLLSSSMREFIRILSDSKIFYFLIAMHKDEGEEMLSSPHFHSRPHQVVYLQDLEINECMTYLLKELKPLKKINAPDLFSQTLVDKSWEYSKGNFRNFKKIYYHLFLLLEYAHSHNKKDFLKPNMTLLRMAAIRSRLLALEGNSSDFEQLLKEARRDKPLFLSLGLGVLLFAGALLLWWMLDKALYTEKIENVLINQEAGAVLDERTLTRKEEIGTVEDDLVDTVERSESEVVYIKKDEIIEEDDKKKLQIIVNIDSSRDDLLLLENSETEKIWKINTIKDALPLKEPPLPLPESSAKRIYIEPYSN